MTRAREQQSPTPWDAGAPYQTLTKFEAAFRVRQVRALLFNIAQCHRQLRHFEQAAATYRSFIRGDPKNPQVPAAQELLGLVEEALRAQSITTLHVDVWCPNPPTTFQVQLVNDPTGPAPLTSKFNTTLQPGSWKPLEIPLASFSPTLSPRTLVGQLLFLALDASLQPSRATIYVDNIYFHK